MNPVKEREEILTKEIVDCCYKVHKQLGAGILERVYEVCFCHELNPVWEAQILSHLKLTKKNLGFLINFNVALIKDGIRRFRV